MILDSLKGFGHRLPDYDVCVVGAGPAGITLALELETTKLRVCLLEAGGTSYERATQRLFEGEVVADNYPLLRDTRVGALGGASNVWAGWCRPLDPIDFEPRDGCHAGGWPFGFDDLQPYYARAHDICGLGPYEYDSDYWSQALGPNKLLAGDTNFTNQVFQVNARNFGRRFYTQLEQSKNIDVVLHAPVARIGRDAATGHVKHVEIRRLNGHETTVKADNFVLATGGIENARLLLASGATPDTAPGNAHGLVGRYFTDHPFVDPGTLVFHDAARLVDFYLPQAITASRNGARVRGALTLRRDSIERERIGNAALFFYPRYEAHRAFESAEVKAFLRMWASVGKRAVPGGALANLMRAARAPHWVAVAAARKLLVKNGPSKRWRLRAMFETESRYQNRVSLCDEQDPLGRPRARVEWQLGERDLHTMSRVIQLFDEALRRTGIGRVERAFGDDPSAWQRAAEGGKHPMGTTRMDRDPRCGVVDENCRVHGTKNLFVAGSSVFPSGGFANPSLTIVALAARLGDYIKRTLAV